MGRKLILSTAGVLAVAFPVAAAAQDAHSGHSHHGHHHAFGHLQRALHHSGNAGQPVAAVASFTGGVLTLTLADGSTMVGRVDDHTRISCPGAAAPGDNGASDDDSAADDHGGSSGGGQERDNAQDDGAGDNAADDNEADDNGSPCSPAHLIGGAKVARANIAATPHGIVFEAIELL